jgi:putative transcriptional regulator
MQAFEHVVVVNYGDVMKTYINTMWRATVLLILSLCVSAAAHSTDEITAPVMLVATDRLTGLAYEETVLLAIPAGDGQHLGLIVNRPIPMELTAVPMGSALPQSIPNPVFFGGPALSGALFAAVRAAAPPSASSVSLMPGLFLVTDRETIEQLLKSPQSTVRYFTGVVVWDPAELAGEIRSGMWDIRPADANILFRQNPQQIWPEFAQPKRHVVAK